MSDGNHSNEKKEDVKKEKSVVVVWSQGGIELKRNTESGLVWLLMDRDENLFNMEMVQLLSKALDLVKEMKHPKALIVGGMSKKFFSNGHDLSTVEEIKDMYSLVQSTWRKVLAPLLVMDCMTCACINGHAFGAGLFLALACDYRFMRTQRGYLNFPELNLGMPLSIGYSELAKCKVPRHLWREAVLTGKRYTSAEALQVNLIDGEAPIHQLESTCEQFMTRICMHQQSKLMRFDPQHFSSMKIELYKDAYRALTMGKPTDPFHSRL